MYEYKPMVYCIPLGLTFKRKGEVYIPFAPDFKGSWDINDLTPNDLQDALADELKDMKIALPALAGNEPSRRLTE